MAFARTTCTVPPAFKEGIHHWAFKYWNGNSVDTGRKIIGELCAKYNVRNFSESGQLRTEYGTCSRHFDYNLFCSCCKIDNRRATLMRVLSNLIAPYCDLEKYMNSGLDYLEDYTKIAPKDWTASVEVINLQELVEESFTWSELVHRIYWRRHWVAVRELASSYFSRWLEFFEEVQRKQTPFNEEEKQEWKQKLLEPNLKVVFNGELLLTTDEMQQFAGQNITKMSQLANVKINSDIESALAKLRYADVQHRWNHHSLHLDRRGEFVNQIVGKREKHRRSSNLLRTFFGHDVHIDPSRKFSSAFLVAPEKFNFPFREIHVCQALIDNPHFAEQDYWPFVQINQFIEGYRHIVLHVEYANLPQILEDILIDLGELSFLKFEIVPLETPLVNNVITAFVVDADPRLAATIESVCYRVAVTNSVEIAVMRTEGKCLVQLCGSIVDELEIECWQ